jgi:hypothetical protein
MDGHRLVVPPMLSAMYTQHDFMEEEGGHTGFGIQREGDLMRGTVAAAEYC